MCFVFQALFGVRESCATVTRNTKHPTPSRDEIQRITRPQLGPHALEHFAALLVAMSVPIELRRALLLLLIAILLLRVGRLFAARGLGDLQPIDADALRFQRMLELGSRRICIDPPDGRSWPRRPVMICGWF
jgi:hypothetical protein